jgi:PKD repeat protein
LPVFSLPSVGNEGEPVTCEALAQSASGAPLTYTWDFGDGTLSSGQDLTIVQHTYTPVAARQPHYTVTLTVSDGTNSLSQSGSITINNEPPRIAAGPEQLTRVGQPVTFQGTATDPGGPTDIVSIQWDFDYDGLQFRADPAAAGNLTPTHIYTEPGIYVVMLQVTDRDGEVAQACTSVVVKAPSALLVDAGVGQDIEAGATATFAGRYDYPSGTVATANIAWDMNYDGQSFHPMITGTLTPSYVFSLPGSYQVALRVTADDGTTDMSVISVRVEAPVYQGPRADAGSDQTVRRGEPIVFHGSYIDPDGQVSAAQIAWDFNYDGQHVQPEVTGTLTPTWQYAQTGSYLVALQVTDEHGLTSVSTLHVTVTPRPLTVTITGESTLQAGDTVQFTGSCSDSGMPVTPAFLAWDFHYNSGGEVASQAETWTPWHTFPVPGTYTVALRVVSRAGDEGMGTMTVTVLPSSGLVVDAGPDQAVERGQDVAFSGSYSDPQAWVDSENIDWCFDYDGVHFQGDPSAHGTLTPTHSYRAPGIYLVALRVIDASGQVRLGTCYVTVGDPPPQVSLTGNGEVAEGEVASFQATAGDAVDASVPLTYEWDWDYDGVNFHADPSATGLVSVSHVYETAGIYQVAFLATDPWGTSTLTTLEVAVQDVPPTASVTCAGPTPEGTPVTFTISQVQDPDPTDSFTVWADWLGTGDFQLLSPQEIRVQADGSWSLQHVYDDSGNYTAVMRFQDREGAERDYTCPVVVTDVAPRANFGPSGGQAEIGVGVPLQFTDIQEPSHADWGAGFTYYYRVDDGPWQSSSSAEFVLPEYRVGQTYTVSAYLVDKDGGASPVYTSTVTVVDTWTVVTNEGTGWVALHWDGGGEAELGPDQYYVLPGAVTGLTALLETGEASYYLGTNGNWDRVEAASGVTGIFLAVATGVVSWGSNLTPAVGSAPWPGEVAVYDTGNVGEVRVPGGETGWGSSQVSIYARGDVGDLVGPGAEGVSGAEGQVLSFTHLRGSITGLDHIGSLVARGWLGTSLAEQVETNRGIDYLSAFGIGARVVVTRDFYAGDRGLVGQVGEGGIKGSLTAGGLSSLEVRGDVGQLKVLQLEGLLQVTAAGKVGLVYVGGASPQAEVTDPGNARGETLVTPLPANRLVNLQYFPWAGAFLIAQVLQPHERWAHYLYEKLGEWFHVGPSAEIPIEQILQLTPRVAGREAAALALLVQVYNGQVRREGIPRLSRCFTRLELLRYENVSALDGDWVNFMTFLGNVDRSLYGRNRENNRPLARPDPNHIHQGGLNDCWLVAPIINLAQFQPQKLTANGVGSIIQANNNNYSVTLGRERRRQTIHVQLTDVDILLLINPRDRQEPYERDGLLLPVLEKAYGLFQLSLRRAQRREVEDVVRELDGGTLAVEAPCENLTGDRYGIFLAPAHLLGIHFSNWLAYPRLDRYLRMGTDPQNPSILVACEWHWRRWNEGHVWAVVGYQHNNNDIGASVVTLRDPNPGGQNRDQVHLETKSLVDFWRTYVSLVHRV